MTENPLTGQTKSLLLTVPIEPAYGAVIRTAAKQENRKVADYQRTLLLNDLRNKGLVDETFTPLAVVQEPEQETEDVNG